ncbi:MAG TPA: DNA mismatch repair protein MutS [Myxococcales bacterium]|nr:DNA mismatch repair protein MutS [Myxococcales bacterium]
MLRQYHEAKAQARDALLLFRLGDFYELFYDDARTAAQVLGITLTSRAKGDDRIPMAGVPHHAARGYIARLVAAGHKVAICDQMEEPGPGVKLVKREIVRFVTPGTLVDDDSLEARDPLWLAALAVDGAQAAIALLDASTGELRALPTGPFDDALSELSRVRPREVLVAEGFEQVEPVRRASGAARIEPRPYRSAEGAEQLLKKHLGVVTLDGFGLRAPLSTQAAAEALSYLMETQRSQAQHVVRVAVEQPSRNLWLDPAAAQNLELFRGPDGRKTGTLLSTVDRTLTAAGGRLLARWLSAPLLDLDAIRARHDAVEELSQALVLREELSGHLRRVLDVERLLGRLAVGQGTPRDLAGLRGSLREMPELGALLLTCSSPLLEQMASPLHAPAELAALLDRALVDEVPPGREPGFVRPGFRAELDELADLAHGGRAAIAAMEAGERQRTGINSLKVRYNRIFGFYIEVTKPNLHLVPKDYERKSSTVGAERFVTPALAEHESRVLSAEERRDALEQSIFDELRAAVLAHSGELRACAEAAAQTDALLSLAKVAADSGWVRPVVDDSDVLDIASGRHPVVEKALLASGEGPFVPNDIQLTATQRLIILTGPNMAGKSTAMRQAALIAILAQSGSFVPAQRARIGLVDRLFTRVGAADDLARGQSTFMVEMAECARILHLATPRSLLILDEVGRGTSTFDGLAIAWAIAEHVHDALGARTLFATHYHELCDLAATKPHAVNLTMAVSESEGRVVFLRKIVPGGASRSYGIQVAKLAGLPEVVLRRAREILHDLETKPPAQLALFAARSPPPPKPSELEEALRKLDLSRMTPLEALNWLDQQQKKLS